MERRNIFAAYPQILNLSPSPSPSPVKIIKKDFEEMEFPTLMSELEEEEKEEEREKEREREEENERKRKEQESIEEKKSKKYIHNRFSSSLGGGEYGRMNGIGTGMNKTSEYSNGNVSRRLSLPYMRERDKERGGGNNTIDHLNNDNYSISSSSRKIENEYLMDRKVHTLNSSCSSSNISISSSVRTGGGLVTQMKRRIEEVKTQAYLSAEKEKKIIEARRKVDEKEKEVQKKVQQANAEKERKRLDVIKKAKEARDREDLAERERLAFLETQKRMEKVRLMRGNTLKLEEEKKLKSSVNLTLYKVVVEKEKKKVERSREDKDKDKDDDGDGGGKARESVGSTDEEMQQTISTGSVDDGENDADGENDGENDVEFTGEGDNDEEEGGDRGRGRGRVEYCREERRGEEFKDEMQEDRDVDEYGVEDEGERDEERVGGGGCGREDVMNKSMDMDSYYQDVIPLERNSQRKSRLATPTPTSTSDLHGHGCGGGYGYDMESKGRCSLTLKVSRKLDFDAKTDFDKMSELAYEEQVSVRAKEEHEKNRRNAIFQLSEQKRRFDSEKAIEEVNERLMRHNRESKRILALQTHRSSEDKRKRKAAADKLILTLAERKLSEDKEKKLNDEIIRKEKQEIEEAKRIQDEEIAKGVRERKLARDKKRILHLELERARIEENAVKMQAERDRVYKAEWERILKEKAVAVRINSTLDVKRSHSSVSASPKSKTFTFQ